MLVCLGLITDEALVKFGLFENLFRVTFCELLCDRLLGVRGSAYQTQNNF